MIDIEKIHPFKMDLRKEKDVRSFIDNLLTRTSFSLGISRALGWRGLNMVSCKGEGWTCKVKNREGVYGFSLNSMDVFLNHSEASFNIYYFPDKNEEILDNFSLKAGILTNMENYEELIRNFPAFSDCTDAFYIGRFSTSFFYNSSAIVLSLFSPQRLISKMDERFVREFLLKDADQNTELPEMTDQDIEAYNLSYSFFEVFASTMTFNLESSPSWFYIRVPFEEERESGLYLGYGREDFPSAFRNNDDENYVEEEWHSPKEKPFPAKEAPWWRLNPIELPTGDELKTGKPELVILSGFLGSGKTTFLKQFIEYHVKNNRFVAVIQNEIGKTGLDSSLLEDHFAVKELDEGCVCCTLIGQLKKGIEQILLKHNPDVIILETTGLANPANILPEIGLLSDQVNFLSLTTVVDGGSFYESLEKSQIARDQVKYADVLLLNKTDQLQAGKKKEILDTLRKINSKARIEECSYGRVNPRILYDDPVDSFRFVSGKGHTHSQDGFSSFKIELPEPLNKKKFLGQMDSLPDFIYRLKGIVSFEGEKENYLVQYVNQKYECKPVKRSRSNEHFLILIGSKDETAGIYNQLFLN